MIMAYINIFIITFVAVCILPSTYSANINSDFKKPNKVPELLSSNNETNLSVVKDDVSLNREARKRKYYRKDQGLIGSLGGDLGGGALSSGGGGQKNKNKGSKKGGDLMSRILPMMVMPFLISSSMIPMALTALKFMLLKSMFIGKMAILLLAVNALWKSQNTGGVYSHNINVEHEQKDLHMAHYGYNGDDEYGAYVNRRSSRYR